MEPLNPIHALTNLLGQSKTSLRSSVLGIRETTSPVQIPVFVKFSNQQPILQINQQTLQFSIVNQANVSSLAHANQHLLKVTQNKNTKGSKNDSNRYELVGVNEPKILPLPNAIKKLAQVNHVSIQSLESLAARKHGYPLPDVDIKNGVLNFDKGSSIKIDSHAQLNNGKYLARITFASNRLNLELSPIAGRSEIQLLPTAQSTHTIENQQGQALSRENKLKRLITVSDGYAQLFAKLERSGIPEKTNNKTVQATDANTKASPHSATKNSPSQTEIYQVLKNFGDDQESEAIQKPASNQSSQSLTHRLLRYLPSLSPDLLTQLASPASVKQRLHQYSSIHLAEQLHLTQITPSNNLHPITLLFQLLLGQQALTQSLPVSSQLIQYLRQVQQASQIPSPLLEQLQQSGTLETINRLASGLQIFQQTSLENQHQWYFAAPYQFNQNHEQLEGMYEQSSHEDADERPPQWKLQLKFNLQSSPLLVIAHKRQESLELHFHCESPLLLSKISLFTEGLIKKFSEVNINISQIYTHETKVPPTILPGDHYLVHTEA
ncbi:hypothetical protein [Shewanella gelidii]|uniref:Uncharacterized protein n=1 Tax=Shewanella gelidii TaxID=1642821 RepID=A0A917N5I9_9GAMM|nr:hypothetical protein [Shewanella gelidii]MCL1096437.1 hypothetical protein [Shewanella gelidii]GGI67399.1 hypothetical protein GCM10009332_00660 [Shewanella gelidii]